MAVFRTAALLVVVALLAKVPPAGASFFCLFSRASQDPCSSFGYVQSDSCAADVKTLHAAGVQQGLRCTADGQVYRVQEAVPEAVPEAPARELIGARERVSLNFNYGWRFQHGSKYGTYRPLLRRVVRVRCV